MGEVGHSLAGVLQPEWAAALRNGAANPSIATDTAEGPLGFDLVGGPAEGEGDILLWLSIRRCGAKHFQDLRLEWVHRGSLVAATEVSSEVSSRHRLHSNGASCAIPWPCGWRLRAAPSILAHTHARTFSSFARVSSGIEP